MNFLEMNGLQTAQTHFKDIFRDNIHRDYADAMLDWLERETDFFTAPSSTKYHGAHTGGLLAHSLNVYHRLRDIAIRDLAGKEDPGKYRLSEEQEETVAIIALLHDVCKVGCYRLETKRRKNPETGRWEDYEGYRLQEMGTDLQRSPHEQVKGKCLLQRRPGYYPIQCTGAEVSTRV